MRETEGDKERRKEIKRDACRGELDMALTSTVWWRLVSAHTHTHTKAYHSQPIMKSAESSTNTCAPISSRAEHVSA